MTFSGALLTSFEGRVSRVEPEHVELIIGAENVRECQEQPFWTHQSGPEQPPEILKERL
jgi:hypothetical protein